MSDVSETETTDASPLSAPSRSWDEIATRFAAAMARDDFRRGDLAELRRMDPDAPAAAAFWRLLAQEDLLGNPTIERKWALILHGIALMTNTADSRSAHAGMMRVGRALFLGGEENPASAFYSESRLNRLLSAHGPMLRTLLARMFRMIGERQPFNWREMARLILNDGYREDLAENARRSIARAYYEAERRANRTDSQ